MSDLDLERTVREVVVQQRTQRRAIISGFVVAAIPGELRLRLVGGKGLIIHVDVAGFRPLPEPGALVEVVVALDVHGAICGPAVDVWSGSSLPFPAREERRAIALRDLLGELAWRLLVALVAGALVAVGLLTR